MTKTRAKAGGEVGMNGDFYLGGEFLPSTDAPKGTYSSKDKCKAATRKQEIAPYVWEVPPAGMWSLLQTYGQVWAWNQDRTQTIGIANVSVEYFGAEYLSKAAAAAEMWNSGQRWIAKA